MDELAGKRILVGVAGGIAAYKSAELVRLLRKAGAEVRVVMTRAAQRFVGPSTFQALSGCPVILSLFDEDDGDGMPHIELAHWAEAILIAPATAHLMARLAHGLADDVLTNVCLATEVPVALAPAMNRQMWSHPATRANRERVGQLGYRLFGPDEGELACGEEGVGRMLEPEQLLALLPGLFTVPVLRGLRVLVTAGPTLEDLDPVRYLGNRSSGKMGYAVAAALRAAGAEVTLISGPVSLFAPRGVTCIGVRSALEMREAVMQRIGACDIFVSAAAVSDYRPVHRHGQKIKKSDSRVSLELVRNPDILAEVGALPEAPFCVGFAAETENLESNAREKLASKGVAMIAANRVGEKDTGFACEENALEVFWPGGGQQLPRARKEVLAQQLVALIGERYWMCGRSPRKGGKVP